MPSNSGALLNRVEYRRFTKSEVASFWGARSRVGIAAGPDSGDLVLGGRGPEMGLGALI